MDAVRNFSQTNRSSIINIVYIVAAAILVYYIVMFFFGSGDERKDVDVLKNKMEAGNARGKQYTIGKADNKNVRARSEYTISFWIYVSSYTTSTTPLGIFAMFDEKDMPAASATSGIAKSFMYVGLHPNQPKMIIRPGGFGTATGVTDDVHNTYTVSGPSAARSYSWGGASAAEATTTDIDALTPCDIMDVDIQRWINVAISVNGRIMDVYMDGKLARSCIMPNVQEFSIDKQQILTLIPNTTAFNGYLSGIVFSNYAITPDAVYARYQGGPYSGTGFLDYLIDKLGIRITYTGTTTDSETGSADWFSWIKPST
jgi:hypothetical protein